MYALILIACTVVAVAIHFGLIRPVIHAIERQREEQHGVVIHAEANAIAQAHDGEALSGCTLYVSPLFPCAVCARRIVDAGISRVVAYCGHISPDWRASADEAEEIFIGAGVECLFAMD